jgi:hypothetical protein
MAMREERGEIDNHFATALAVSLTAIAGMLVLVIDHLQFSNPSGRTGAA